MGYPAAHLRVAVLTPPKTTMKTLHETICTGSKEEIEDALEAFAPVGVGHKASATVQSAYNAVAVAHHALAEAGGADRKANPCTCGSRSCGYCTSDRF